MSIQSEIDRISGNVQDTLDTIAATGVAVGQGSDALPAAAAALANRKLDKDGDAVSTGTKIFKGLTRLQSGAAAGGIIIGADVAANTLTNGVRKLARIVLPSSEDIDFYVAVLSADATPLTSIDDINTGNMVEFGGRTGDKTNTSPDKLAFTVANEHNSTASKILALLISKSGANFAVTPKHNGKPLSTQEYVSNALAALEDKVPSPVAKTDAMTQPVGMDGNGQLYTQAVAGPTGPAGANGITPTIGSNGNWYLGSTDTGKPSRGATGATGAQGPNGAAGAAGTQIIRADTDARNFTTAQWDSYGAPGHVENWVRIANASAYRVGDIMALPGTVSDKGGISCILFATVTAASANAVTATTINCLYGSQGQTGATGAKGDKGDKGDTGAAGKTPVKGTDYFTAADKNEIAAAAAKLVPVDTALSASSTNPVQNKVVNASIAAVKTTADAAMPKAGGQAFSGPVRQLYPNLVAAAAGAYLRSVTVQNSAGTAVQTGNLIMVRK